MLSPTSILFFIAIPRLLAVKLTAVKFDLGGLPPNLTGALEQNFELTDAERYKVNELQGPESFVFYRGHIYTGLSDGRIVDISDCGVRTVAKMSRPGCKGEQECGRPLGLRLDSRGRLLVADSSNGIFRVNVDTGEKQLVVSSKTLVNGKQSKFINDVIVAKDGTILYTDSSTKWSRKEFLYVVLEGEATGRLLAYSEKSNKTIVVLDKLAFPNGLEFGPNEEYLLISETSRARVRKLSLKPGKTWLQLSTFVGNLPGLPDNIRASGRGTYWVAMSQARHQNMSNMLDEYANQPEMREMVALMSSIEQIMDMNEKYGMVVEVNENGEIVRTLQDPTGNQISSVSEAAEHDGFLYLGSYGQPFVSRIPLSKAFNVERFLQKIKSTCRATKINISKVRSVLRRLVAIAELRRVLLNAKRRREQEEKALQKTRTSPAPIITSTFSDLLTTTAPLFNNTTAPLFGYTNTSQNVTQNVTEPTTTRTEQVNATLSTFTNTTTAAAAAAAAEVTTSNPEMVNVEMGTTASTISVDIVAATTTAAQVMAVNPSADVTETEGVAAPRAV
ncbi:hypothetical protein BsWGS_02703 [Bradybaena similaris]